MQHILKPSLNCHSNRSEESQVISAFLEQPEMFHCAQHDSEFVKLKSDGFDEFHKIRFLFFNRRTWTSCLEKPDATVTSRPGRNGARFVTSDVGGGERRISGFKRSDLRVHSVWIGGRETHL